MSVLRPLGPQPRRQPADDVERHAYFRLVGLGRSVLLRIAVDVHPVRPATGGRDQFGAGNKYITPVVANGRVFVGTTNGVAVFGLLP